MRNRSEQSLLFIFLMIFLDGGNINYNEGGERMITYKKAKTLLIKADSQYNYFGHDYYFNIYRGCSHGCIYCDSRSSCYHVENFDSEIIIKENCVGLLHSELSRKKEKSVIGISGAMCDVYMPIERELKYTRKILEVIARNKFAVQIHTKSDLILRDLDLLKEINEYSNVNVLFTITAFDDNLSQKLEPGAPNTSRRLLALKRLSDEGITTGVAIWPVLPFITDDSVNIRNIIRTAKRYGAKYVLFSPGVTLRDNQREYYLSRLNRFRGNLAQKYVDKYGTKYNCESEHKKDLLELYYNECRVLNLSTKTPHYRFSKPEQLTLF
jgi:DNA repair photolyase